MSHRLYRQQSTYSSCALDVAINARIFLGGSDVSEEEYESLVDLVRCRYGAALQLHLAYPLLGLIAEDGPVNPPSLDWASGRLPVEIGYHDPVKGLHSALVVGVEGGVVALVGAFRDRLEWGEVEWPPPHVAKLRAFRRA